MKFGIAEFHSRLSKKSVGRVKKGQVAPAKLRSAAHKHHLLITRHNAISYTIKKGRVAPAGEISYILRKREEQAPPLLSSAVLQNNFVCHTPRHSDQHTAIIYNV